MVRSGGVVTSRLAGAVAGAVAAGALAAAGLGSAPPAQATCASFFGLGNSAQCTSNPTSIAIAIGNGATANAGGLFSTALAVGNIAGASTGGAGTFATAVGEDAGAFAYGLFGMATELGSNGVAETYGPGVSPDQLGLNFAFNVSAGSAVPSGSVATAVGIGNIAVNIFGTGTSSGGHYVVATGTFNAAMTFGGTNNKVSAGAGAGTLNSAFSVFGTGNTVTAGPGPLAVAGSILQTGATVTKHGPGFNINGFAVGGAAAVGPTGKATRHPGTTTAAAGGSGGKATGHPRSARHGKQT